MEEDGTALFLCPNCGAFVSASSDRCPNCGAVLEAPDEEETLELETLDDPETEDSGPDAPGEETPEDTDEAVTLFLCSECGAFTSGDARVCPNCGAPMLDDDTADAPEPLTGPEAEIADMLVKEEPEPDDKALLESLSRIESAEDVVSFIESLPDDIPEDMAEIDLEPPADMLPERSPESDDLLSQLIYAGDTGEDGKTGSGEGSARRDDAVSAVEDIASQEESALSGGGEGIAICSHCGAFVPSSAEVCNVCGQSLMGQAKFVPGEGAGEMPGTTDEDADRIIRSLLGVDPDADIGEEKGTRFQSEGSLGMCTVCGAFISQDAEKCPVCGTHVDDMPEFVPSVDVAGGEPEEKGLAICPHCGVFVQEGATECMSCARPIEGGARVEADIVGEDREAEADRALRTLRGFMGVERALGAEPVREETMRGLDICPDCGAFVSKSAVVCSVCGNSLVEGEADIRTETGRMECPNCGSWIPEDAGECPLCGMAFGGVEPPEKPEDSGEDITEFLERELEDSIMHLEAEAHREPGGEAVAADDELTSMLVGTGQASGEEADMVPDGTDLERELEDSIMHPEAEAHREPGGEAVAADDELTSMLVGTGQASGEEADMVPDATDLEREPEDIGTGAGERPVDETGPEPGEEIPEGTDEAPASTEVEPLEFIEPELDEEPPDESAAGAPEGEYRDHRGDGLMGDHIPEPARAVSLPVVEPRARTKPANWATGIYLSVAAICLFLGFYAIVPGDYAPGLAVIFGTLALIGLYLFLTERGIFFRGDLRRGGMLVSGTGLAAFILLHWPWGFLNSDRGLLAQPYLDRLLLSVSIILLSIGILWLRARVRYVFVWYSGTLLLFLATVSSFTYHGWGAGAESPVLLVAGLGASLVFVSFIFLQYERALGTTIESDIVRGDAHYLRKEYGSALESYDRALARARVKSVEVLASPIIEYDVPWYSKGSALILMGEYQEGIKCLDMALAINPNNEVTWVNKGNAHSKMGQHDVAMECYARAIEVNPFYEIAWNNMGNVLARRKRYIEALKHYNRAIKINPGYDDAWINKGYVLAKMGKREEAVKCLARVGSRSKIEMPGPERDTDAHAV